MSAGDFGVDCENCWCLTCIKNDETICKNCSRCDGNISYRNWMMDCEKCKECKNPEEDIEMILDNIIS